MIKKEMTWRPIPQEKGLEILIVRYMTGTDGLLPAAPVGTDAGPTTDEEDLAKGIIDATDMDSYRADKQAAMKIALAEKNPH